jgi:RimJ/RimL family protein N-acetyltransferase
VKLLIGEDAYVSAWVAKRIPHMHGEPFPPCTTIGVVNEEGDMLGGVVFTNHHPRYRSVEWSAAADSANWLSRPIINTIMMYPFEQLGCVRITAIIPRRNKRSREFQEKFGFKNEGLVRRGFGGDDALIFGLMRSEWARSPLNMRRELQPVTEAA